MGEGPALVEDEGLQGAGQIQHRHRGFMAQADGGEGQIEQVENEIGSQADDDEAQALDAPSAHSSSRN